MKHKNNATKLGKGTFRKMIDKYKLDGKAELQGKIEMELRMSLRQTPAEAADTREFVQVMEWALEELSA